MRVCKDCQELNKNKKPYEFDVHCANCQREFHDSIRKKTEYEKSELQG